MNKEDYSGVFTALITPFKSGSVDKASLKKLVKHQLDGGVKGLVVNGTTAESPCLSEEEVLNIYQIVSTEVDGHVPLIMGTGSNNTAKSILFTKKAEELKAVEAALVVVPYYNKPTQEGMYQHFAAIAENTKLDVVLYNVPGRTVADLNPDTVARLSSIENIKAIKDATGDLRVIESLYNKCPKDFAILSGDDATYLDLIFAGGVGVISVIANIFPKLCSEWNQKAIEKDDSVLMQFKNYLYFTNLLFQEPNPGPAKTVLKHMGIIESDELRLPLVSSTASLTQKLSEEYNHLEKLLEEL